MASGLTQYHVSQDFQLTHQSLIFGVAEWDKVLKYEVSNFVGCRKFQWTCNEGVVIESQEPLPPNRGRVWCYILYKSVARADEISKVSIVWKV